MARRIVFLLILAALPVVGANLPSMGNTALAAGLDEEGKEKAKEAMGLFKQGLYEEAARIFAKLSVDYPDMEIFERNLGACLYYQRKFQPALSSLRRYLARKKNIAPDDKVVVDRWIDEMEELRAQTATTSVPSAPSLPPVSTPSPMEPKQQTPAAADSLGTDVPSVPRVKANPSPTSFPAAAPVLAPRSQVLDDAPNTPAGIDLTSRPAPSDATQVRDPYYKTWWFWTGTTVVVVAGTVTAILLAGLSNDPCEGISGICLGVP